MRRIDPHESEASSDTSSSDTRSYVLDYWLYCRGARRETQPWPLVLYLHGAASAAT